jgi:hypothetical protein
MQLENLPEELRLQLQNPHQFDRDMCIATVVTSTFANGPESGTQILFPIQDLEVLSYQEKSGLYKAQILVRGDEHQLWFLQDLKFIKAHKK